MRIATPALALLFLAALTGWAADSRTELMEADRAFARDTAARGLDGWMDWFADDAVANGEKGVLRGKAALRGFYGPWLSRPGLKLVWEPLEAEASPDGRFGYTIGRSSQTWTDKDGKVQKREGRYLTVWRKGADGKWKVVTDQGN